MSHEGNQVSAAPSIMEFVAEHYVLGQGVQEQKACKMDPIWKGVQGHLLLLLLLCLSMWLRGLVLRMSTKLKLTR